MSDRASACRKKAAQCEHAARVAADATARAVYLDVASLWRKRSEHSEALEQLARDLRTRRKELEIGTTRGE
jgi:hypothetical protein